jgi:hypothetical protein
MVKTAERRDRNKQSNHSNVMSFPGVRSLAVLSFVALMAGPLWPALAQQGSDAKPADQQKANDAKRSDGTRRTDEIAEAARTLTGPAANPECVWLGERAVNLLSRDDLDTAFRHLELYDRFGCPGAHMQASFRCLVRLGIPDPKAAETLDARIHACWLNPAVVASAVPAPAAAPAAGAGAK